MHAMHMTTEPAPVLMVDSIFDLFDGALETALRNPTYVGPWLFESPDDETVSGDASEEIDTEAYDEPMDDGEPAEDDGDEDMEDEDMEDE